MARLKPIVINGTIRSGTTWLMELLSQNSNYFPLFEPLDSKYKEAQEIGLWFRYLDPVNKYPEIDRYFDILFKGEINKLTPIYNSSGRFCKSYLHLKNRIKHLLKQNRNKLPILKFTRGHFFLPYLYQRFSASYYVIFRHPCAVLESAGRKNFIETDFENMISERQFELYRYDIELFTKIQESLDLLNYKDMYQIENSPKNRRYKILMIKWAISNYFVIKKIKEGDLKVTVVYYEDMILKPQNVQNLIEKNMKEDNFKLHNFSKLSFSADKNIATNEERISLWQKKLPKEILDFCQDILDIFGIDIYSIKSLSYNHKV